MDLAEQEELMAQMQARLDKLKASSRGNAAISTPAGNQEPSLAPGLRFLQHPQVWLRTPAKNGEERSESAEGGGVWAGIGGIRVGLGGRCDTGGLGDGGLGGHGGKSGIDQPAMGRGGPEGGRLHGRDPGTVAGGGGGLAFGAGDACHGLLGAPLQWKPPVSTSAAGGAPGSGVSTPDSAQESTPGPTPVPAPESTPGSGGSARDAGAAPAADVTGDTSNNCSAALRGTTAGPDEWLRFLNRERLRWESGDRSAGGLHRLCRLYVEALESHRTGSHGGSSSSGGGSYAELHVQYARLRAVRDPAEGRAQFDHARNACRRVARVHVAAAQFALDSGLGADKGASILRKATEAGAEPRALVAEALRRLRAGDGRLMPPEHDDDEKENAAPPAPAKEPREGTGDGRRAPAGTATMSARRIAAGGGGGAADAVANAAAAAAAAEIKKTQQLKLNSLLLNAADSRSVPATPTVLQARENLFPARAVPATPSGSLNAAAAAGGLVAGGAVTAARGVAQTPLQRAAAVDGSTPSQGCDGGARPFAPVPPASGATRVERQSSCRSQDKASAADLVTSGGGGGRAGQNPEAGGPDVPGDPRVHPSDCKRAPDNLDGHPSAKRVQQLPARREPPPQHKQQQQQQQQPPRNGALPEPQPVWTADARPRQPALDQGKRHNAWKEQDQQQQQQQQQYEQEEMAWRDGRGTVTVNGRAYCLLNVIGRGGSGKVYSALDLHTRTIRAVKHVPASDETSELADAYDEEIKHLQRLQHLGDKIIRLLDHEVTARGTVMVMELGSVDLSTWLRQTKRPSPQQRRFFWHEMVQIVGAIHAEGVVHGDLKPANFVFTKGYIKLIDFGIAKALHTDVTSNVMEVPMGTINYMAPEMVGLHAKVGHKSDVWALGCILYLMTYESLPFQKLKQREKLQAICNHKWAIDFPPVDDDAALVDVLKACLVRDPRRRISIAEVLEHPYLKPERRCNCGNAIVNG